LDTKRLRIELDHPMHGVPAALFGVFVRD
jgi:hypothetical protein